MIFNLTMNRLTNEQHMQIIEFYYQNACSVKKVNRTFLPFYHQFNRQKYRSCIGHCYWWPSLIIDSLQFAAIGALLLNNLEIFAEGFRCKTFPNTAGQELKPNDLLHCRNFGVWTPGNLCQRSTSLSKNCVQLRSSILALWVRK